MIKAKLTDGSIILGLSRLNCGKLLQGKPIVLQLSELGLPAQKIIIVGGENEQSIMDELTRYTPLQPGAEVHVMSTDGFGPPKDSH